MERSVVASMLEDAELIESIDYDRGDPALRLTARGSRLFDKIGRVSSQCVVGLGRLRRLAASPRRRRS